jgi:hypothetical protein
MIQITNTCERRKGEDRKGKKETMIENERENERKM